MSKDYQRIHRFSLEEVLPYIGTSNHKFLVPPNRKIHVKGMGTQRMRLLQRVQHCEVCQIQGSHFWLECSGCYSPHFNLYAKNHHGHDATMMTMDHILPRSKGGGTNQENIQLLCRHCNKVKKNYLITNEDILRLRFRGDPFLLNFVIQAYSEINPDYIPVIEELYANRKRPIIEKDVSWFAQFSPQQPSSPCLLLPQTEQTDSQNQSSGVVESSIVPS